MTFLKWLLQLDLHVVIPGIQSGDTHTHIHPIMRGDVNAVVRKNKLKKYLKGKLKFHSILVDHESLLVAPSIVKGSVFNKDSTHTPEILL